MAAMKDFLVHVDDSQGGEMRVACAFDLAKEYGAHITGMHVTPEPDLPIGSPLGRLDALVALRKRADSIQARRAQKIFLAAAQSASVPSNWISAKGDIPAHVAAAARFVDLIILGQNEAQGDPVHHPLPICHHIVLTAGRPLLILPESGSTVVGFDRILIAWDGSRESVRAVHDAIPILKRAKSVSVIVVRSDRERLSSDVSTRRRLSDHLLHHSIVVGKWVTDRHSPHVAKRIRKEIDSGAFDLLIMGGYSRPDWYEFIVGGTTHSLLLTSPIPVLISH